MIQTKPDRCPYLTTSMSQLSPTLALTHLTCRPLILEVKTADWFTGKKLCGYRFKLDLRYRVTKHMVSKTKKRMGKCKTQHAACKAQMSASISDCNKLLASCIHAVLTLPFERKNSIDCQHRSGFVNRVVDGRLDFIADGQSQLCKSSFGAYEAITRLLFSSWAAIQTTYLARHCMIPPKSSVVMVSPEVKESHTEGFTPKLTLALSPHPIPHPCHEGFRQGRHAALNGAADTANFTKFASPMLG